MASPLLPMLRLFLPDYPSAKLYAYLSGTTTETDTYNNTDLAPGHANAHPVVAAASGLFGDIYLDPAITYKFIVKTSADVEIFTIDPVSTVPGQLLDVLSKTEGYTVAVGDGDDVLVLCDATTSAFTLTLFTAVGNAGKKIKVVKIDSTTAAITIDPNGSQTINGISSWELHDQWESIQLVSDGSNWISLSEPDSENETLLLATQVFS